MGFSLEWLLLLQRMTLGCVGSVVEACRLSSCSSQALEQRLNNCGTRGYLPHSMWNLPVPGMELGFSGLADGVFTTEPPGQLQIMIFFNVAISVRKVFNDNEISCVVLPLKCYASISYSSKAICICVANL